MKAKIYLYALILFVVVAGCESKLNWQDFEGGTQLTIRVDPSDNEAVSENDIIKVIKVLEKRLDQLDIENRIVKNTYADTIIIQVPKNKGIDKIVHIIEDNSILEFKLVDKVLDIQKVSSESIPENEEVLYQITRGRSVYELKKVPYLVYKDPLLTGAYINKVKVDDYKGENNIIVSVQLDNTGSRLFEEITQKNINKRIAIVINDNVYSAPLVKERIKGGKFQITGNFNMQEASYLTIVLRSGPLPNRINVVEQIELRKKMWLGDKTK